MTGSRSQHGEVRHSIVARWSRTCCVPPSPELRQRWEDELAKARESGIDAAALGLARKPRRVGFDDGVIIPPEDFALDTPLETIAAAAANRAIRPGAETAGFAPLHGTLNVVVVLVDFADQPMTAPPSRFEQLMFSTGVLPTGSVREFYTEATNGKVTIAGSVVGPYRMPQTLAWYANDNSGVGKGGGDFRSPQLALDAAKALAPALSLASCDNDGNGYVDAFIVVHAGAGAEVTGKPGDIWSHKATLDKEYAANGAKIYGYLTIPEDAKVGVCAHELGHLLFGFPDLYDIDYSSEGIGDWCLMSGGSWNGGGDRPAHPSAWCKVNQDWASVTNVTANGTVTLPAVETAHSVVRLWKSGAASSEYFLLENRQRTGFDDALPGEGLLVWHIDETKPTNSDETHFKVALLQADGKRDLELGHNRGDAGDPFPGAAHITALGNTTTPNTKSYANQSTSVSLADISPSGPTMSATVTVKPATKPKDDPKPSWRDLFDQLLKRIACLEERIDGSGLVLDRDGLVLDRAQAPKLPEPGGAPPATTPSASNGKAAGEKTTP